MAALLAAPCTASGVVGRSYCPAAFREPPHLLVTSNSVHSMTSSARARREGGISTPSSFAVLLLITRSNFVGCWTGRSPGLAPLIILSTYTTERRINPVRLAP